MEVHILLARVSEHKCVQRNLLLKGKKNRRFWLELDKRWLRLIYRALTRTLFTELSKVLIVESTLNENSIRSQVVRSARGFMHWRLWSGAATQALFL